MTASHPEYSMPVYEMMARLGVEPGNTAVPQLGVRYATAMRRCEHCESRIACREWLDRAPAMMNFAPDFCANSDILFELRYDQSGPRHCDKRGSLK